MVTIGITMGCPAGIGPEIILRYFHERSPQSNFNVVVLGDQAVLSSCAQELNIPVACAAWQPGTPIPQDCVPVMQVAAIQVHNLRWGRPTLDTGKAMGAYIQRAVELVQAGQLDGIATCPISKAALQAAGYGYPGHTEMLADLTGARQYAMMMAGRSLRVTLATIHCSLASVPFALTEETIASLIEITHDALRYDFNIPLPRIGVAGLNPHAGEEGLFGNEEQTIITPAIGRAQAAGIEATGPFPPDTVFFKAVAGDFDAVVCMYHDQGLIPFKLLHFSDGVNVTLGLPIVRTSVDHGTAYDIAGKGIGNHASLAAAVELAATICANRQKLNQPTA